MRVLDTESLEFVEFQGVPPEPYVILSHTWAQDEVNFEEMIIATSEAGGSSRTKDAIRRKHGFEKIRATCDKAKEDGFRYAWIDTCCIDKKSNAELSEAINSIFFWYEESTICYAYLVDIPSASQVFGPSGFDTDCVFRSSRWFTRGWTLQELLAPDFVELYAADWTEIGTKFSMANELAFSTKIQVDVLRGERPISACVAAERMSWAANRQTTRIEDVAYSLLGIMNVHMPLLYGEGEHAFIRLQEAMMRRREDYSLLLAGFAAWITPRLKTNLPLDEISVILDCEKPGPGITNALAPNPNSFFVEDPTVWSYSLVHLAYVAGFPRRHSAPCLTANGLQVSLSRGVNNPLFNHHDFNTNCIMGNYQIQMALSPVGIYPSGVQIEEYVRCRAFYNLVPFDYGPVLKLSNICILNPVFDLKMPKSLMTERSSGWMMDISALTGDTSPQIQWLLKPSAEHCRTELAPQGMVAVGWCTKAPGETENFLLVIGDYWGEAWYESAMPEFGFGADDLRPWRSGSSAVVDRVFAISKWLKAAKGQRNSDRLYVFLRSMLFVVSFRRTSRRENHWRVTLTMLRRSEMTHLPAGSGSQVVLAKEKGDLMAHGVPLMS